MNKNILVLAIAGVLAAPFAAQAGAEVYGKAHVAVGQTDNGATSNGDSLEMLSNGSNIGFRGDEDLGNGLSAIYQAEVGYNFDGAAAGTPNAGWATAGGRNSYVGLKGDWGKAVVGRHDNPYKLSTGRMDPFSDTQGDYNAIMGFSPNGVAHDTRTSNSIMYVSPNLSGFTVMGMYGVNDRRDAGSATRDRSELSVGATYNAGPLFVGGAWQSLNEQGDLVGTAYEDDVAIKIGAGYTLAEATTFNVAYETIDTGGTNKDRTGIFAGVDHKMGANTLALTYAMADDVGSTANSGATQVALGAFHSLSKATQVYALYSQLSRDEAASTPGYGIFFSGASPVTLNESGSALMVGVTHNFSSK